MEKTPNQALKDWIKSEGRKVTWLADTIPVNRSHLHQWLNGTYIPREVYRIRIAEITKGAVPVSGWSE